MFAPDQIICKTGYVSIPANIMHHNLKAIVRIVLAIGLLFCAATVASAQAPALPPAPADEAAPADTPETQPTAPAEAAADPEQSRAAADPALRSQNTRTDALKALLVPLTADELASLTAEWQALVQDKLKDIADLQVKLLTAEGDAASALRDAITKATDEKAALLAHYNAVTRAWETKGGDAAAIEAARRYVGSIQAEAARTTDPRTLALLAWNWTISVNGGLGVLWKLIVFLVSIYILIIIARVVRNIVGRRIGRVPKTSKLLQAFLVGITYWLVLSFGLMLVLAAVGVDITPLFALVGGASFIVAFAMQDTLSNLANGLLIMVTRPFDEGDYVSVGGTAGTVKSVNVIATTVITPDNQVIVMPNKQVWGSAITNVTASHVRRVDLVFGISYNDDIRVAIEVMKAAVDAHELTLDHPEPMFAVGELGDNSVNLLCRPWVKTADYWTVYWDLMGDVKVRFDAAGISIPFPQRDVHIHQIPAPEPRTGDENA